MPFYTALPRSVNRAGACCSLQVKAAVSAMRTPRDTFSTCVFIILVARKQSRTIQHISENCSCHTRSQLNSITEMARDSFTNSEAALAVQDIHSPTTAPLRTRRPDQRKHQLEDHSALTPVCLYAKQCRSNLVRIFCVAAKGNDPTSAGLNGRSWCEVAITFGLLHMTFCVIIFISLVVAFDSICTIV